MIGSGAKVLGPFTVGDNSKIAAGAVVLSEVPPDSTCVGVPARIVRQAGRKVSDDLDQVKIPDPVSLQMTTMTVHLKTLERKIEALENELRERNMKNEDIQHNDKE